MLNKKITHILDEAQATGWVLEPDAKKLLSLTGIKVPVFETATNMEEAQQAAGEIGYPVAVKIVSPDILHKSEARGVRIGIKDDDSLRHVYNHFIDLKGFKGMLIEEMVKGVELIIGGKIDYQFGPVIILGIGGTGVEIYKDTALRMAPLIENDVLSMVNSLTAHKLLKGYRGSEPINFQKLSHLMITFSKLLMDLNGRVESVDLNPVMCTANECVVADARIILE